MTSETDLKQHVNAEASAPAAEPPRATLAGASQWELIKLRFSRHKLALISAYMLVLLYLIALFAEFVAPWNPQRVNPDYAYCPPQVPRVSLEHGLYVYPMKRYIDPVTLRDTYTEDRGQITDLGFFVRGDAYKLWGLIPMNRHLLGVRGTEAVGKGEGKGFDKVHDKARDKGGDNTFDKARDKGGDKGGDNAFDKVHDKALDKVRDTDMRAPFYLFGADRFGRDLFSRIVYGARISLSVGLVGILISFTLGCLIGGISGYAGGAVDNAIQRFIEMMNAIPTLPLWIVLAGMMPVTWSPLKVYFAITVVLSLLGWRGLARVVRGKIISLREEDYAMAARLLGASRGRILVRHLLPGMTSHILVSLSMTVPGMILGETGLSFLGLGLRPPVVSWGVLLQDCMRIEAVVSYSWLLMPVFFIILAVMCFNFVGDGLRDAADPYH